MSEDPQKRNSDADACPCGHPQAPREISVETADKASDNHPYNKGGEAHGPQGCSDASL